MAFCFAPKLFSLPVINDFHTLGISDIQITWNDCMKLQKKDFFWGLKDTPVQWPAFLVWTGLPPAGCASLVVCVQRPPSSDLSKVVSDCSHVSVLLPSQVTGPSSCCFSGWQEARQGPCYHYSSMFLSKCGFQRRLELPSAAPISAFSEVWERGCSTASWNSFPSWMCQPQWKSNMQWNIHF